MIEMLRLGLQCLSLIYSYGAAGLRPGWLLWLIKEPRVSVAGSIQALPASPLGDLHLTYLIGSTV